MHKKKQARVLVPAILGCEKMPFATETSNSSLPKYILRPCVLTESSIRTQDVRTDTLYAGVPLLRLGRIIELLTFRIAK